MTKYTIEAIKKKLAELEKFTIAQLIRQHPLVRDRAFLPDETANALTDHFDLTQVNQTFQLVPKEKRLSTRAAGEYADADEAIEDFLTTSYKSHLMPGHLTQDIKEESTGIDAPQKPADARLEALKVNYQAAKERRDYGAMTALKRQIAQAGYAADIL